MTDSDTPLIEIASAPVRTKRPPWLLIAGAAIAAALWLLIKLASEVREGEVLGFDRALMLAMRVPGHPAVPATSSHGGRLVRTGSVAMSINGVDGSVSALSPSRSRSPLPRR